MKPIIHPGMMNIQPLLHAVISEATDKMLGSSPDFVADIVGNGLEFGLLDQGFGVEAAIAEHWHGESSRPAHGIGQRQN